MVGCNNMDNTDPIFSQFDKALGKTTPTTSAPQVPTWGSQILASQHAQAPAKQGMFPTIGKGGLAENITPDVKAAANTFGDTFKAGANEVTSAIKNVPKNAQAAGGGVGADILSGLGAAGHVAGAVAGTAGGLIGDVISPLIPKALKDSMSQGTEGLNNDINKIPGMTPELHKSIADVVNTFLLKGGAKAEPAVADLAKTAVEKGSKALETTTKAVVDATGSIADTAGGVKDAVQNKAIDFYKKQSLNDWEKPTTVAKPAYSKATQIAKQATSKGNSIPETLVNNGVKLSDNIQEGKYATKDTAEMLRSDAGKMSSELLRPSLQMADYTTAKIPVENVLKNAKSVISNDTTMTLGDKETAISKLEKEGTALQKKYPDGMSLENLHDNKITYSQNAGHNPLGTRADNISANTNNAIATSLKTTLEKSAPSDVPVKEVNGELSKRYQAANYLDALNGKPVPRGLGSKIAQTAAKVTGAVAGESLGGGLLGGVGGYHLAGAVEKFIENMTNPVKAHFLNNLEKTNPEAFAKVRDYLGKEETAKLTRPQLEAPAPLGSAKNPIIAKGALSNDTTFEAPAQKINREKLPD